MISALENSDVRARFKKWSVDEYHRIFELGLIGEKFELIRGVIVAKDRQSPMHCYATGVLRKELDDVLPDGFVVRQRNPLTLSDSEPEPDLAVVLGEPADYRKAHPATAMLVIEVVIESEPLDRLKSEIYAEAGIPECWLIFPEIRVAERHTRPEDGVYQNVERFADPQESVSTIFRGVTLVPAELFKER